MIIDQVHERKELRELLEKFTLEDFKRMHEKWLLTGRLLFFVHGNFTKQQSIDVVSEVREILNLKPVSKDTLSTVRCV